MSRKFLRPPLSKMKYGMENRERDGEILNGTLKKEPIYRHELTPRCRIASSWIKSQVRMLGGGLVV